MIIPDINLLLHAYNSESPSHVAARAWWERLLNGSSPVGLAWVTVLGLVRITTHRQVMTHPLPVATACGHARTWLTQPYVSILHPADRHAEILFGLLERLGTADADFVRFPGLRWTNPIG